jgi:hypothetical protein
MAGAGEIQGLEKCSGEKKVDHFHIVPGSAPFLGDYSQEKSVPRINLLGCSRFPFRGIIAIM